MAKRAKAGGVAIPWFVIALCIAITMQRLLHMHVLTTMDSCEQTLFWLSRWDEGRAVLQWSGLVLFGFVVWFFTLLFRPGHLATKAASAAILVAWVVGFDAHLTTILPDRSLGIAARFAPHVERVSYDDWSYYPGNPYRTSVVRSRDETLSSHLEHDDLGRWQAVYFGSAYQTDGLTGVHYYRLARASYLSGARAPYAFQMDAIRSCIAYNRDVAKAYADDLAEGATGYPRNPDAYRQAAWDERTYDIARLPPVVYDPVPYGIEY